ncbi:hypothetical protein [Streptomyces sp. NPDC002580]|uniref:hypothetical protein n=1 Tax=Streptomyces sp. NPDC002580 TaxID=3364653 RepID=UPI00368644F4
MTPWLRTLPTAGLLAAALLNCGVHLAVAAPTPGTASYATAPVPSAEGTAAAGSPLATDPVRPTPTADTSRAGSLAGEGRVRPGRSEPAPQDPEDIPEALDTPDPEATESAADTGLTGASTVPEPSPDDAAPVQQSVVGPGSPPEPVLELLPLGTGLILIGVGLGLAFVALRVRRS